MGLVLDSGVLIAAERDAKPVQSTLVHGQSEYGENEIVLSSITVIELEHGLHRANAPELIQKRRDFRGNPGRALHEGDGAACRED